MNYEILNNKETSNKSKIGLNKMGDQGQSQTLAVSTKPNIERVVYQTYVSIFDGLYMSNFKRPSLVRQHYSWYHSKKD
jgi:hypothetical protein